MGDGRPPHRQQQILSLLQSGPRSTSDIAKATGMTASHARWTLRQLRDDERVCVIGHKSARSDPQSIWGLVRSRRMPDQWDDLRREEEAGAERRRFVADALDRWGRFMRSYWGPDGYPREASGMPARARIHTFDDLEDELDRILVRACNGAIDGLSDRLRACLFFRCQLQDYWPYGDSPNELMDDALELLAIRLSERIAVPR